MIHKINLIKEKNMKRLSVILMANLFILALATGCGGGSSDNDDDRNSATTNNEHNEQANSGGLNNEGGTPSTGNGKYQLLAWNDLGMHCMDGNDYSVFSILPPYNNLVAQLVEKQDGDAKRITSGVTLTYEALPSLDGKLNTTSKTKTNFWTFAQKLFGANLAEDIGLTGNAVQSTTPQALTYNAKQDWWSAEGIPTSPKNDDGSINHYPMVKVTAKDTRGTVLATTTTVLPVSDEMDCRICHGSNTNSEAKPSSGWVNNADAQKDYKLNILKLHDDKHSIGSYLTKLEAKGYIYKDSLSATQASGTPVLCAACHTSNALPGSGVLGVPALTRALHSRHAGVVDPTTGQRLNNSANRNACYTCHPGATTQCLRGAMGKAKNPDGTMKMQCQSCHGEMNAVGKSGRDGWLDEPNCQNCHQQGQRHTEAVTDPTNGTLREVLDNRFATTPNTPAQGKSLYRFSRGHGSMQCSACHGSTHAIYPSLRKEDNLQSISAQGHAGTIAECTACHTTVPQTANEGPHGMHSVGQYWVDKHKRSAKNNQTSCQSCHGTDYRGSELSKTFSARTFDADEYGTKKYAAGDKVSCYDCHNGPDGE